MTEPNFRELCAELADSMDSETGFTRPDGTRWTHPTVVRVRAELATPPPEPPTDEELVNFRNRVIADWCSSRSNNGANLLSDDDLVACQAAGLRAVLERWGQ